MQKKIFENGLSKYSQIGDPFYYNKKQQGITL